MPPQVNQAAIFGGSASATPSQGSIMLYTDAHCNRPFSESPTPVLVGTCFNAPAAGISAVSISSLPSCPDDGTPLLVVSNVKDCKLPTVAAGADGGASGECQGFSSSVEKMEIASAEFVCYGLKGRPVPRIESRQTLDNDNVSVNITCPQCPSCVIM